MNRTEEIRILAIDPTTKGFAFAILEGDSLIDWGLKSVSPRGNKEAQCLSRIRLLIEIYQPGLIILEDCSVRGCRRCPRVRRLVAHIRRLASDAGFKTRLVSRAQVRHVFAPAATKHAIASSIAQRFPELAPHLPPPRKFWRPEDARMNIFGAMGMAIAIFLSVIKTSLKTED